MQTEDYACVVLRHLDLFERKNLCAVSRGVRQGVLRYNKAYGRKMRVGMVEVDTNLTFARTDDRPLLMRQEVMNARTCQVEPFPKPWGGDSHTATAFRSIVPKVRLSSASPFPTYTHGPRHTLFRKRRQYCFGNYAEHVRMNDVDIWPSHWAAFPGGLVHSRMRQVINMYRWCPSEQNAFSFFPATGVIELPRPKVLSPVTSYEEVYPLWADDFHTSLWVDSLQMLFLAGGTNTNLIQVHCYDAETKTFSRRFHLPFFAPLPETGMTLAYDETSKKLFVVGGVENMRKTRKISWIDLTDIEAQVPKTQDDIDAVAARVTEAWISVDQHAAMHVGVQLVTCPWSSTFFQMKYPRSEPLVDFLEGYLVITGGQTPNGVGGGSNVMEFIHMEEGARRHFLFHHVPPASMFTY